MTKSRAFAAFLVLLVLMEGWVLRGYSDPVHVPTACAGHTGSGVAVGELYSEDQCRAWLVGDATGAWDAVDRLVTAPLTAEQHLAFADFVFNLGYSAFAKSTMLRKFNAGDTAGACAELKKWIHGGGRVWPGLVKRRQIEYDYCVGKKTIMRENSPKPHLLWRSLSPLSRCCGGAPYDHRH